MVASTDIKFFVHSNNSAPQLTNNFGCMLNVLDAALINGIQVGTVSSLTALGKIVTAVFGTAHNLMQYQVIKTTGANQAEYNVEARILTVPNATTITFELAVAPSVATATGTINCSLPPLGWEKPFSSVNVNGGGKAAYRSKNLLLPSRPFLRVVDELDPAYTATYAKYAKVGIVEDMIDIDTMMGVQAPYDSAAPNKNWVGTGSGTSAINGWARWYYARAGNGGTNNSDIESIPAGNRSYLLVGNNDYFYLIPTTAANPTTDIERAAFIYGFGNFERLYDDDVSNTFLSAAVNTAKANDYFQIPVDGRTGAMCSTAYVGILLHKDIEAQKYWTARIAAQTSGSGTTISSGSSNYLLGAPSKSPLFECPLVETNTLFGSDTKTFRGKLMGYYFLQKRLPFLDFQVFTQGNTAFIAKIVSFGSVAQIALKIGDL